MRSLPLLITLIILAAAPAAADIYRYVDDGGTVCFTDAPRTREAVLVVREPRQAAGVSPVRRMPPHMAASATGANASARNAATPLIPESGALPVSGRITSLVGLRIDPIDGLLRQHNGVDIAVPSGTPVRPVAPGTVLFSGRRPGYGTMVVVDHGSGFLTVYAHHSRNNVTVGEPVTGDTVIALSGSTGRSTGPHLHFEAWRDEENITDRFIGGAAGTTPLPAAYRPAPVRRALLADGSLLFTNLPLSHP